MKHPSGAGSLLVIIPAFNEEGAIAGVVRSVLRHVPDTPVLVIDDSSTDGTRAAARAAGARHDGFDGYAFTIAFKGVLLEGLEVAFIVLTFGANQHRVALAAAAAGLAVLVVVAAGAAARAPLAKVPENTLKFAVGVMLSSFGMFWGAEGAGASWPGGDAALLAIIPGVLIVAIAMSKRVARTLDSAPTAHSGPLTADSTDQATVSV